MLVLLLSLAVALGLSTEETGDVQFFKPEPFGLGYLLTPSHATINSEEWRLSFWSDVANDPLILLVDGERVVPDFTDPLEDFGDAVIDQRWTSHVQVSTVQFGRIGLAASFPVIVQQTGYSLESFETDAQVDLLGAGIGDANVAAQILILPQDFSPVGIGFSVPMTFPTSSSTGFMGEPGITAHPKLVLEFSDSHVQTQEYKYRGAICAGYLWRQQKRILLDTLIEDSPSLSMAFGYRPAYPLELVVDVAAQREEVWLGELALASKWHFGPVVLNLGGAAGLIDQPSVADYRVLFGVQVEPRRSSSNDIDRDGILNSLDKCPELREDRDGFEDTDGCPDLDDDRDGVPDKLDRCLSEKEDIDGFEDLDGCIDLDNDQDNIIDRNDRCPNQPENRNGHQDQDGCPDETTSGDLDQDGFADAVDRCPFEAEDKDGYQDEDGCPDPDNDHDGVLDDVDQCPLQPETINGIADADGCPDERTPDIWVDGREIKLREPLKLDAASLESSQPALVPLAIFLSTRGAEVELQCSGEVSVALVGCRQLRRQLLDLGVADSHLHVRSLPTQDSSGRSPESKVKLLIISERPGKPGIQIKESNP